MSIIKTLTALLFIGCIIIVGFCIILYTNAYNYGNLAENQIKAEYTNMENILGQYSLKIKEAAQIPSMKTRDLENITKESMSGRYGDDGSKAIFQWITEQYPGQITDDLYIQIQQIIESGRNKFENAQTKFIDNKRDYEINLGTLFYGSVLKFAGYPNINLDEYVIISSQHASESFDSKIDNGITIE